MQTRFNGLFVHLRPSDVLYGFEHRDGGGLVVVYPTARGDIAQLNILVPPSNLAFLPRAREIGVALEEIEQATSATR